MKKNMTYLGMFMGKDMYIDGTKEDADKFIKYFTNMQNSIYAYQKEKVYGQLGITEKGL